MYKIYIVNNLNDHVKKVQSSEKVCEPFMWISQGMQELIKCIPWNAM